MGPELSADPPASSRGAQSAALPPSMRDRVPFLLYRAAQASLQLANQMLAEAGLEARQAGILTMVIELEPMTQKALGDALRIDRTTMVKLIDDLEARGLVVRHRHPRDRRAFLVSPTGAGRTAKVTAIRILDRQQQRFLAPLTQQERDQLRDLLISLYAGAASGVR
jgi:DNA-binding MarR family transcriptional regulator